MGFLNTIIEFEGPVVNVRPRFWAAHKAAVEAIGFRGPEEDEFWRLWRTGAPDGRFAPHAKPAQIREYIRLRDEKINTTELMALDEAQPGAAENFRLLKQMGACHLVTLCKNRDGINDTLDRLFLWLHFDKKQVLPEERPRRIKALREMTGGERPPLAVAGTVPFAYAAGEAGCRVIGMKHGPAVPDQLRRVGVDVFYDSLDELTDALTRRHPDLQRIGVFSD